MEKRYTCFFSILFVLLLHKQRLYVYKENLYWISWGAVGEATVCFMLPGDLLLPLSLQGLQGQNHLGIVHFLLVKLHNDT